MAINYGSLQATLTPRGVVSGKVQNATRAFVKDYDLLDNKPKVNGVELLGDKSLDDLGIEIPEIVANPGDTTENLTSIGIDGVNYNIQGSGGSAVTSVNGKTGDVNLDAEDVGALPDDTPIPSELADLSEDSTHRTVTDTEKQTWDNKSDFSGSYNDLEDKPNIPDELSDLTDDGTHRLVTDIEKTTWNAKSDFSGSYNDLTDKPTLGTAAAKDYATSVIDGSNDLVTGDAVHEAIDNAVSSSYHHAGTKTCAELVSGLLIKANEGNVYNITDSGVTTADFIEGQGLPIRAGDNVGVAKVSDGVFKFDLLSGFIDTSNFVTKSSTAGLIKNDGSIDTNTYALASSVPAAQIQSDWNQSDNTKLDYIKNKPTLGTASAKNIPSSGNAGSGEVVMGNDTRLTDARNAADVYSWAKAENKPSYSKSEVGLGNVDNTSDTTKKANFTGSIASENTGFVTGSAVYTALGDKVDKVEGKGLSTNDYDNTAKGIVDGVTNALAGKANISEMSVTDGTGADADKTTIQLKSGTSATVLKTHQDISGKADKVSGATNGNLAGLDANGNLTDSGVAKTDIDDMQDELSTDSATATGNPINFTTKSTQNAESTIIDIEPIQDLHGYDKPWVGGAGKNKLPMTVDGIKALNTSGTWTGNVYTINQVAITVLTDNDDNVTGFDVHGTASASVGFVLAHEVLKDVLGISSGSVTLNGCPSGGVAYSTYQITINDGTNNVTDTGNGIAFDVSTYSTTGNTDIFIRLNSGYSANHLKFYPMIRLSTETDPTYEPYTNICPISGRTEIGILGCDGKNLFNKNTVTTGMLNNDGTIDTSVTTVATSDYIIVKGLTNIVFSGISSSGSSTRGFCIFDAAKNVIASNNMNYIISNPVVTIPNNAVYLRFSISISLNLNTAKIEVGATPTVYKPYVESNNITISLGQTVYGGTLDIENGVLVVDRAYETFDGSNDETWYLESSGTNNFFYAIISNAKNSSAGGNHISNEFEHIGVGSSNTNVGFWIVDNIRLRVRYKYDNTLTVSDLRTWLSSNNLEVCYELATPITINLTPHQISLLEGVNNISTDGDKITLTYRDGKVATLGDVSIAKALDVQISNPVNGQVLKYDSTEGKWKNANESGGGSGHNYSTTEQVVGTWIDGKTLYEKTFTYPGPYSGNAAHDLALLSNINFIGFEMFMALAHDSTYGNDVYIPIPCANAAQQYMVAVWVADDSSKMTLATYGGYSLSNVVAVVRYTKTTD